MKIKLTDQREDNIKRIDGLLDQVMTGELTDDTTSIDNATESLKKMRLKIEGVETKASTLDAYHQSMMGNIPNMERSLKELKEKFGEREKLWENIKDY